MAPNTMIMESSPNISDYGRWTMEGGYINDTQRDAHPFRVFNARHTPILSIMLGVDKNNSENICPYRTPGFSIVLHTPGDIPSREYLPIPLKEDIRIIIKPTLTRY